MGVGADLYMYDVVVKTFTFAISSTDEFLYHCSLTCSLYVFYHASASHVYAQRELRDTDLHRVRKKARLYFASNFAKYQPIFFFKILAAEKNVAVNF